MLRESRRLFASAYVDIQRLIWKFLKWELNQEKPFASEAETSNLLTESCYLLVLHRNEIIPG